MYRINIIGAGRLGKTMGRLLMQQRLVTELTVCNQTSASAQAATSFIGAGRAVADIDDLPMAEITMIAASDAHIESCAQALAESNHCLAQSIVIHFSGALSSEVLSALRQHQCALYSVHPMMSFAQPALSVTQFTGCYCAIEGDKQRYTEVFDLFAQLGANCYRVTADKKAHYHAAGVMASNYLITLFAQAEQCLLEADVAPDIAKAVVASLMQGTLTNLRHVDDTSEALTGPINRGDTDVVAKHMQALATGTTRDVYAVLGRATLALSHLDSATKTKLVSLLG